jgi:hypothetical protein
MAFADLPPETQTDLVLDALQKLLGDNPSKRDYIARCQSARAIAEALEDAMIARPLPEWEQVPRVLVA